MKPDALAQSQNSRATEMLGTDLGNRSSLDPPICAGGAPVWTRRAASRPGSGPGQGLHPAGALRVTA